MISSRSASKNPSLLIESTKTRAISMSRSVSGIRLSCQRRWSARVRFSEVRFSKLSYSSSEAVRVIGRLRSKWLVSDQSVSIATSIESTGVSCSGVEISLDSEPCSISSSRSRSGFSSSTRVISCCRSSDDICRSLIACCS